MYHLEIKDCKWWNKNHIQNRILAYIRSYINLYYLKLFLIQDINIFSLWLKISINQFQSRYEYRVGLPSIFICKWYHTIKHRYNFRTTPCPRIQKIERLRFKTCTGAWTCVITKHTHVHVFVIYQLRFHYL